MKKILLAIDSSEKSQKAVEKTKDLASSLEAEVTIITVVDESAYFGMPDVSSNISPSQIQEIVEESKKQAEKQGRKLLDEAENYLTEDGVKIDTVLRSGDSADNICDYAEEGSYDLIILSDKGEGGVKRFLLGSTSDRVVRHAETSVLIVK